MTSYEEFLASTSSAYTEQEQDGDGLLRIHWHNGDQQQRTPGSFFVSAARCDDHGITPQAPWKPVTKTFRSGSSEAGFEATHIKLALIAQRRSDIIIDEAGVMTMIDPIARGAVRPQGWSLLIDLLVIAEGFGVTPVVWSSKRIKTSLAMLDILKAFRDELLRPVQRTMTRRVPPYYYWMQIASRRDEQRRVLYERTKGAPVTPPDLFLGDDDDVNATARKLFVGVEIARAAEALYIEHATWSTSLQRTAAPAAAPSRNAPKPIDDADMPF